MESGSNVRSRLARSSRRAMENLFTTMVPRVQNRGSHRKATAPWHRFRSSRSEPRSEPANYFSRSSL